MNNLTLKGIFEELCRGNLGILTLEVQQFISQKAMELYNESVNISQEYAEELKYLIMICNVTYNRTSKDVLPVEDGVYDILIERYKNIDPNFQVGSAVVQFEDKIQKEMIQEGKPEIVRPIRFLDTSVYEKDDIRKHYKECILRFEKNCYTRNELLYTPVTLNAEEAQRISKRSHNTSHNHPDLVGTLDKCKFVLDKDAMDHDVYNDDRVKILERDWFVKHINEGIITPDQDLHIMIELKYDGISVEADCTDEVVSARTRGDTGIGQASDITPLLKGYKFIRNEALKDREVGVKFEAIMTKSNLIAFNKARGYSYANCRTAIIGLFGASDAYLYRDYITLVPLALDRENVPEISSREEEVVLLNKLYQTKGCPLRYVIINGNYQVCLYLIKKFLEEASAAREYLDFMFDGIVVSYLDKDIRMKLGRDNFINKYQMAVKFDAQTKITTFLGYTFEVGQNGAITPMIHYAPVEFNGTIHPKSTGSSYKRFRELALKCGDFIKVTYTNDVMPYVESLDCEHNRQNPNPLCEFTPTCPACGTKIVIPNGSKIALCPNIKCLGRKRARMVNMLQKLNFKGFAESTISQLEVYTLKELFEYDNQRMAKLIGPGNTDNFKLAVRSIMSNPIEDFKIIGSLGFTNTAAKTWKIIFSKFNLPEFIEAIEFNKLSLEADLLSLKGIGISTVETIIDEYKYFKEDIHFINDMFNVVDSRSIVYGKQIRFTGCRDGALEEKLRSMGHDVDGNGSVTKRTDILLIPYEGYESGKVARAPESCIIVTLQEFANNLDKYL